MCLGSPQNLDVGCVKKCCENRLLQRGHDLSMGWSTPELITDYVQQGMKTVLMTQCEPGPKQVTSRCLNIWVTQAPCSEAALQAWVYAFCYFIFELLQM